MMALLGLQELDTNVNVPNVGQMRDAPLGAVVETYAAFRRDSVKPLSAKPLPPGVATLVRRVAAVQKMTLEAAMNRDVDLAFQAMLNDLLVNIPTDTAWKMFTEMLRYTKSTLKGWKL